MGDIVNDFKGLPIEDLIAAPLVATANSQTKLAMVTADFIKQVGIDQRDGKMRTVEFRYDDSDAQGNLITKKIDVPLLSVVNIPSLSVKNVDINFSMEVKTQVTDKSENEQKSQVEAGFNGSWWSPWSCKITGSVSTKSEHTRNTDKSAKYDIKVQARDDGMPEGLSRVLDILASNISPNAGKKVEPQAQGQ